jgi:heavy metal translocating P-type ATPase
MSKRALQFLRDYYEFNLAVLAIIVGLILQLTGLTTANHWLLGVVAIIGIMPLIADMWQDVRTGSYGIDILAITAVVASVVLHQYWAAIVIIVMLTGGEALEDYAEHRAKTELNALLARAPQLAHIIRGGKTIDVEVSEVHLGDKISIRPGEVVPVDATILDGSGNFDESSLTGESLPQFKSLGSQVLSGSINEDGVITAKAIHEAQDSQYQQIIRLVRSASASKAPFVRLADRYSIPFTVLAYIIGLTAWYVGGHAIRFLDVIVVATPCPLLLAAPIALISGMSRMSKHGIIVKTGSALEQLAEAETFAFDKTGTLTLGKPTVDQIEAFHGYKKDEVLSLAASLEQHSNHVLASAVLNAAQKKNLKFAKAKHISESAGHGLSATLKGTSVLVGRLGFMEEQNVTLPPKFAQASIRQTAAYVAVDGHLVGVLTFKDELRDESKGLLKTLQRLGIKHTLMITGDNKTAAGAIAKRLGITDVTAEALPADKLFALEAVKERPVVFVGDGVNDAPVLTSADVGIALGARGSTAASESADIVILQDDISLVGEALITARRTFSIAKQSILIGIAMSVGLMFIFFGGHFSPLLGAVVQEVVDVVVIFNALRARAGSKITL